MSRYILPSLILHFLLLFLSYEPQEDMPTPKIKVVMIEAPEHPSPLKNIAPPAPKQPERKVNKPRRSRKNKVAKKLRRLKYQDLLDFSDSKYIIANGEAGKDNSRKPYQGDFHGELSAEISDFSGYFYLPLHFRRFVSDGKASAKLVLRSGEIWIKALRGSPEIRAALFKTLHNEETTLHLIRIFKHFQKDSFTVSIEVTSSHDPYGVREFENSYHLFANDILLKIHKNLALTRPDMEPHGFVDDKYARMARKRDRLQLRQLRLSLPFRQSLYNYKIDTNRRDIF